MVYFVPFLVLVLIYINTSKYEHYEHFLCTLENKISNMFGSDTFLGKIRTKTKEKLLKINKNAETLILKI